jgi:glycosyltransferase involved in cell wall biosynthesis
MRILILTHRVPFPQNGGYPIAVCNTIRGLVDLGHEVSLFSLNTKKVNHPRIGNPDALIARINYQLTDVSIDISWVEAFLNLFNPKANNVDRFYNPEFEQKLMEELRGQAYDVVQFEGLYVTPYLNAVRRTTKAKLIYRSHNIEYQVWKRLSVQKHDPLKKWYLGLMARRIKKYELQQLNKFDAITVFTRPDMETLQRNGINVSIGILPIGIDIKRYNPDLSKTEFPSLFFLGSLDWLPNREGMEWFLDNFYTDLTTDNLRVKFYVAGNDVPEQFDDYEAMGKIFIQGEVDDALEFVNSKAIMVVPLLSGGGMRVKIVEGMAMQKCIIATSLGAEGINYKHGENILIANTREEFYKAIKRCISDEEYCKNIGRNARKLAEKEHDMAKVADKIVSFYNSL